jgi:multiple sugar transport system ATP-binding protein
MVHVTHDQVEAMMLADRIVLLKDGRIEQQRAPLVLFERPRTRFVAGFLGSPSMNFGPAVLAGGERGTCRRAGSVARPGARPQRLQLGHDPLGAVETEGRVECASRSAGSGRP